MNDVGRTKKIILIASSVFLAVLFLFIIIKVIFFSYGTIYPKSGFSVFKYKIVGKNYDETFDTPNILIKVKPGKYHLEATKEDYKNFSQDFVIKDGKTTTVDINFITDSDDADFQELLIDPNFDDDPSD
jgi:hypothetical protein